MRSDSQKRLDAYARANRHEPTYTESRLWSWLRDRRMLGYKFRRQHRFSKYVLDFYCPELRLAVEVDGSYHELRDVADYDSRRTLDLMESGIVVVRVTNEMMRRDSLQVEEILRAAIHTCAKR